MGSFSFPKFERLLNRNDFVNLNRLGKRQQTAHFTIIFLENDVGITRLGITVNRKMGNAVKRNKLKRRIREFYRLHKSYFPRGFDIVIAAKQGAIDLEFFKIKEELGESLLHKTFRV